MKKLTTIIVSFVFVAGIVAFSGVAYASEHTFTGKIMNLSPIYRTFWLSTAHSGKLFIRVPVHDAVVTDGDHSTRHFSDFRNGMLVKVRGDYSTRFQVLNDVNRVTIRW